MSSTQVTAIVPRLPPVVDGVGDYALALARNLRASFEIETRFIVGDPTWPAEDCVEGFAVDRLPHRTAGSLLESLPAERQAMVLLHYGGYAYAKRGCPAWLVEGLEQWRNSSGERGLVILFHELYASGRPWNSSFWLSRRQRTLTEELARLSNGCTTSLVQYVQVLHEMGVSAESLPVFSSIGEPFSMPSQLSARRRRLVVFGTRGRRAQVYRRSTVELNRICRELGIEEVWDIGREMDFDPAPALDVPVNRCGEIPGHEVSDILLDSVAGVIDYPAAMLGKSTIFAAYCAHRLVPLVASYGSDSQSEGLEAGIHYRLIDDANGWFPDPVQQVANNAFDWYQSHTLAIHAKSLAARLERVGFVSRESFVHA